MPTGIVETILPAERHIENARRQDEERQRPAGIRRHIPCRQFRNDLAGGETE
ncbi:MAG: hypothetical protein ACLR23_06675 [Clostridia bacterium]